jgi:hypothetical protein
MIARVSELGVAEEAPVVRLIVKDDLERNRLTVFFRLLLAIPHLIWLTIWSIGTFFVAIANWFVALVTGKPADSLHRFLSRYIRYAVHVRAYLSLAANRFPDFMGERYDIDVELPPPMPQSRWKTLLRIFLALPALILSFALGGPGFVGGATGRKSGSRQYSSGGFSGGGLLAITAFLGWFASLARGRMPRGLRDASAFSLGFGAQAAAYVLLVTERYPDADPVRMLESVPPITDEPHPVRLETDEELRRSRVTVFFRIFLAIPHLIWITLWGIAIFFAAIANWFVAVITGQPAASLQRFSAAFVRYAAHLTAYIYIVANPFPGFTGTPGTYPVEIELPSRARQSRWITGFRAFLAIPAALVSGALGNALFIAAFYMWFTGVILGRVPRSLRNLGVYSIRYSTQLNAYALLVTARYPHASPLVATGVAEEELTGWVGEPPDDTPEAPPPFAG